MLYYFYELTHAAMTPMRAAADCGKFMFRNPLNPISHTVVGRGMAAACELVERTTRRYGKPPWGLTSTVVDGQSTEVEIDSVWNRPFCRLVHFDRQTPEDRPPDPKVLIVAPMSGHYATLLRGTVDAMLPEHDVYVTDWVDARTVPLTEGGFNLDDYIDYVIEILRFMGPGSHVMAVCQPSVPVLAAVSLMEEDKDPCTPQSMILMGGPIDTRVNPSVVNSLVERRGESWFRDHAIVPVPFPHAGAMRDVYPGFLQLTGFMTMNLDLHVDAHKKLFQHLIEGDGDSADKHRAFYDEFMAVMDLPAEFYLQTLNTVFVRHDLPKGRMMHRRRRVDPSKVQRVALMTIEGERDDISGVGQTKAAQHLCVNIPEDKRAHYLQKGVGHYGVFNGSRYRNEVVPRITSFIRAHQGERADNVVELAMRSLPSERVLARESRIAVTAETPERSAARSAETAVVQLATAERMASVGSAPAPKGNGNLKEAMVEPLSLDMADEDGLGELEVTAGSRPGKTFLETAEGTPDVLSRINGIGPKIENDLNTLGIFHYWQLAQLGPHDISRIEQRVGFPGRVMRDDWVGQAQRILRDGGV